MFALVKLSGHQKLNLRAMKDNPVYHTEEDTTDNIDFDYMTEIVKLYVATLAREAGVIRRR